MELDALKTKLLQAGIVGCGGAGFPSYAKLNEAVDVFILNGAECEPLINVDKELLIQHTDEILKAFDFISGLFSSKGYVAVKRSYKNTIKAVESEISTYEHLEIKILEDVYPAGDEISLCYDVCGRVINQGQIPISKGIIVYNVETMLNFYNCIFKEQNLCDKYLTIAGEIKRPSLLKVPVGTSFKDIIDYCGGPISKDYEIISGGVMTGKLSNIYDTVTKTTKAILLLKEESAVVQKRKGTISRDLARAMSVCSQCQMCSDLCPRGLLGHAIKPHLFMRAVSNSITSDIKPLLGSIYCCECGVCEMYACHQGLSPRRLIAFYKSSLREKGVTKADLPISSVDKMREYRKIPEDRLSMRLNLHKYETRDYNIDDFSPKSIKLMLSQNIGAKNIPIIEEGAFVEKGEVVAKPPEGKLGVFLHTSVSGVVTRVCDDYIKIESDYAGGDRIE